MVKRRANRALRCPEPGCEGVLETTTVGECENNMIIRTARCNCCRVMHPTVTTIIPREYILNWRSPMLNRNLTLELKAFKDRPLYSSHKPIYPTAQEIKEHKLKVCTTCSRLLPPHYGRRECWKCADERRINARVGIVIGHKCSTCKFAKTPTNMRDPEARQNACQFNYPEAWTREADDCFTYVDNNIKEASPK